MRTLTRFDLRIHDPDRRALRKAARAALVMSACFLFGVHVVDNSQFAVVATFTAAAILGIAYFSGSRNQRLKATAVTLAVGAALLPLGTAVSSSTAAASLTMVVVTLAVGYSAVFSGYFAAASSAVIVFYVVATGVEGPASVIPAREAGLLVGGALSLVAVGWFWPSRATAECRTALAAVYRELATQVGRLAPGDSHEDTSGGPFDAQGPGVVGVGAGAGHDGRERLAAAILAAEQAIARSAWRPDGLASPHKARMYLLEGARRLAHLVNGFSDQARGLTGPTADEARELMAVLQIQLDHCATALATEGRDLPRPSVVEAAKDRLTRVSRAQFADETASGLTATELRRRASATFVLHQLSWGVVLAAVHCRIMHGAPPGASAESGQSALVATLTDGPSWGKWIRRARRNFSLRSVHLQNSLRLALGLGLARLVVGVFGLQHGFWVGFATLVVLKTSAAGTRSTALQAALGTAVGFGLSTVLITSFGVDAAVYSVLLPVVIFAAFYLPGAISFVAGQACFTMVIVVLFNLLKPAGWTIGLIRVEDVVIGSAIGLAIGMAIWPRGASAELSRVVGRLFVSGSEYVRATVVELVGPVEGVDPGDAVTVEEARRLVAAVATDAEDVFSQYLSEPHQPDAPVGAWSALMASAHQVWFGAGVVGSVPPTTGAGATMPQLCGQVLAAADDLELRHRCLAARLEDACEPEVATEPTHDVGLDRSTPQNVLVLFELEAWLGDLEQDVTDLDRLLERLRPRRSLTDHPVIVGSNRAG